MPRSSPPSFRRRSPALCYYYTHSTRRYETPPPSSDNPLSEGSYTSLPGRTLPSNFQLNWAASSSRRNVQPSHSASRSPDSSLVGNVSKTYVGVVPALRGYTPVMVGVWCHPPLPPADLNHAIVPSSRQMVPVGVLGLGDSSHPPDTLLRLNPSGSHDILDSERSRSDFTAAFRSTRTGSVMTLTPWYAWTKSAKIGPIPLFNRQERDSKEILDFTVSLPISTELGHQTHGWAPGVVGKMAVLLHMYDAEGSAPPRRVCDCLAARSNTLLSVQLRCTRSRFVGLNMLPVI